MVRSASRWSALAVVAMVLLGLWYALPNVLPASVQKDAASVLPDERLSLGLDLQGGAYLLLQIDMATVEREQQDDLLDSARQALRSLQSGASEPVAQVRKSGSGLAVTTTQPDAVRKALRSGVPYLLEFDSTDYGLSVALEETAVAEARQAALERSLDIIRLRLDESGTKEPLVIRQGDDRILVQMPGVDDPSRIRDILGKTAKLTFHLVDDRVGITSDPRKKVPGSTLLLPMQDDGLGGEQTYIGVQRRAMISGDMLKDARATFNEGEPVVSFRFNALGGKKFARATTANVGRPFAIVLDNEVISAPRINEPIIGGSGIISGSFTTQGAGDLALLLRSGSLPAPLTIIEERTVGAGLGADSVAAGSNASILALVLVVVTTIAMYGLFGTFAAMALAVNLILLMALLTILQATLTLPGIAGIVLTIGMAVDANVLIFERIREEMRLGRGAAQSIDNGYRMAFGTIMDSNITTLVAGVILYVLGTGPVRGFAVTLVLGILTSMFSAMMVTRLLVAWWLRRHKNAAVPL